MSVFKILLWILLFAFTTLLFVCAVFFTPIFGFWIMTGKQNFGEIFITSLISFLPAMATGSLPLVSLFRFKVKHATLSKFGKLVRLTALFALASFFLEVYTLNILFYRLANHPFILSGGTSTEGSAEWLLFLLGGCSSGLMILTFGSLMFFRQRVAS